MEPSMQTGSAELGALESRVSGAAPWLLCSSRGILWDPAEPWLRSSGVVLETHPDRRIRNGMAKPGSGAAASSALPQHTQAAPGPC